MQIDFSQLWRFLYYPINQDLLFPKSSLLHYLWQTAWNVWPLLSVCVSVWCWFFFYVCVCVYVSSQVPFTPPSLITSAQKAGDSRGILWWCRDDTIISNIAAKTSSPSGHYRRRRVRGCKRGKGLLKRALPNSGSVYRWLDLIRTLWSLISCP